MKAYLDIVQNILENGKWKTPIRMTDGKAVPVDGGVKTLMLPNQLFSHNMQNGFPLLTTKKMPLRTIAVELEGFIQGITSKKWYQERKCKIWNEWANPLAVRAKREANNKHFQKSKFDSTGKPLEYFCEERYLDCKGWTERDYLKHLQSEENDLGPVYGFQWRRFNECYDEDDNGWADEKCRKEADQLQTIVNTLHTNYNDRRMVCSAWNPLQLSRMGLPACHWGWNITVCGNELNLFWVQRSCDLMLGVPFNIASYALLLELLSLEAGLEPGRLDGMLVDCHIYENQIDIAKEQIKREPRQLPNINFFFKDIFSWTHKDLSLVNYDPYPKLDFGAVAV